MSRYSPRAGLYAEQPAEEIDLLQHEAVLGSTTGKVNAGSAPVIDTGLHEFGWSRDMALEFYVAHVPMLPGFDSFRR